MGLLLLLFSFLKEVIGLCADTQITWQKQEEGRHRHIYIYYSLVYYKN